MYEFGPGNRAPGGRMPALVIGCGRVGGHAAGLHLLAIVIATGPCRCGATECAGCGV